MPHASPPPRPADHVQLPLPLKWVPSPARERLRDAHPFPLVGIRDDRGFRSFRTHPRPAWSGRYEYLQAGGATCGRSGWRKRRGRRGPCWR